jgi:hypothetical protein
VGPQQAVDEESTRKTWTPTEDGHEMPFFLTGGVKSVIPSSGRVWRWLAATAAATEVAAIMVMVFCVGRLRGFLVLGERRGEKPLVEL